MVYALKFLVTGIFVMSMGQVFLNDITCTILSYVAVAIGFTLMLWRVFLACCLAGLVRSPINFAQAMNHKKLFWKSTIIIWLLSISFTGYLFSKRSLVGSNLEAGRICWVDKDAVWVEIGLTYVVLLCNFITAAYCFKKQGMQFLYANDLRKMQVIRFLAKLSLIFMYVWILLPVSLLPHRSYLHSAVLLTMYAFNSSEGTLSYFFVWKQDRTYNKTIRRPIPGGELRGDAGTRLIVSKSSPPSSQQFPSLHVSSTLSFTSSEYSPPNPRRSVSQDVPPNPFEKKSLKHKRPASMGVVPSMSLSRHVVPEL
jgi:hypothetical protein